HPDRPHERARESPDIGPHDPFSGPEMGHHVGSNCIRSPPAKAELQDTELARISQRVMRTSDSDPEGRVSISRDGCYGIIGSGLPRQSALIFAALLAGRKPN